MSESYKVSERHARHTAPVLRGPAELEKALIVDGLLSPIIY